MSTAIVRRDLAARGERIYDHKTGRYYPDEVIGTARIHWSDDWYGTVGVLTEGGLFLVLDSIDLDYP